MGGLNFVNPPTESLQALVRLCQERNWTLGFAESCTGGLLSAWLTALPGVSNVFQGSVVSYSGKLKKELLGVATSAQLTHGQVSPVVARLMARGAREHLNCDWSLSITGIAGPSGGSVDKPVGTVCFGVCGPGFEETVTKYFDSKQSRQDIQRQAALFALDFLLNAMK